MIHSEMNRYLLSVSKSLFLCTCTSFGSKLSGKDSLRYGKTTNIQEGIKVLYEQTRRFNFAVDDDC